MFDAATYRARRRTLLQEDRPAEGLVLLPGNTPSPRNYADNPHPFRQDSTFLYYFGHDRPHLCGVMDLEEGTASLYGRTSTLEDEIWTGGTPSLQALADRVGAQKGGSLSVLEEALADARARGRTIHFPPPYRDAQRLRYARWLGGAPDEIGAQASEALARAVIRQRSVKTDAEVAEIEDALTATAQIHRAAQRHAVPGATEQSLVGRMTGRLAGANRSFAFPPTCSIHGEVLHNHASPNTLAEGDLLLVDAGATSPRHYAGDITRVTPVGGRFTERQRALYTAVLAAQEAALQALAPGVPFVEIHRRAAHVLTEHLMELGLMQGDPAAAVAAGAHALFFPHGLGHMVGLDVHDMESLGEDRVGYADDQSRSDQFGLNALRLARPLRPGYVVTVEPGCYFIPPLIEHWRAEGRHDEFLRYDRVTEFMKEGGIRLEDDALITADGARVLGPSLPKSVDAVEAEAGAAV
jgi:Xaa-Pro aminopeptidase